MKIDARTFAQRCGKLPSLRSVCHELTRVIQNPDSSISEISNIIGKDQSLAAHLLKLANSVFYGFPSAVSTLEQAVQIIGLHEIRELVLATSVIEAFDQLPENLVEIQSFWKHSVACGLASALLGKERNHPETERLFVGGLLHDIGRLVMFLEAPEASRQILQHCEREGRLTCNVEIEVLGFDHATLGAEIICAWNLPRSLVQMVRCHHNPSKSSSGVLPDTFIIHYADFITSTLQFGNSGEFLVSPLIVPAGLKNPVLADNRIASLVCELEEQCEEIFPILTTNLRSDKTSTLSATSTIAA